MIFSNYTFQELITKRAGPPAIQKLMSTGKIESALFANQRLSR